MRLLAFDIETTGFDPDKDRIIELGYALYDTTLSQVILAESIFLNKASFPVSSEQARMAHGISEEVLLEFGQEPSTALFKFGQNILTWKVSVLVGHNSKNFDLPFLIKEYKKEYLDPSHLEKMDHIDTRVDLIFEKEPDSRKLKYMAADAGFLQTEQHRAMFDAITCLKVLLKHDVDKVLAYSKIPFKTVEAVVTYDQRELAKGRGYQWQPQQKKWTKTLKETEVEAERKAAPFSIQEI